MTIRMSVESRAREHMFMFVYGVWAVRERGRLTNVINLPVVPLLTFIPHK